MRRSDTWQGEMWNRHKSGEIYPEWRSIRAVKDEWGRVVRYISIFADITKKRVSEERIYHLAHFDPLTDLPNRTLFHERLDHAIIQAQRQGAPLGVLFLDLDRFKFINDTLGHASGDELLRGVAHRLSGCVRKSDTVARIGGDELTIVLTNLRP